MKFWVVAIADSMSQFWAAPLTIQFQVKQAQDLASQASSPFRQANQANFQDPLDLADLSCLVMDPYNN